MSNQAKKEAAKEDKVKAFLYTKGILIGLTLVAVLGLVFGIYYFYQYQKTQKNVTNPAVAGQFELKDTVEKVGRLVELPVDEEPTLATVSDVTKLKNQPFFIKARNGDKVLIYQKAKKAILYRPSTNKIVEYGPISLGSAEQTSASPSAAVTPTSVKVALYNGTKTAGFANSVEKDLKTKAPNITVVSKGNASKSDYIKTLVVDLTGTNTADAKSIAQLLNGEVGKLPAGESASPSADILVILGK